MREIAIIEFFPRIQNRSKENVDKIITERHKKIQAWLLYNMARYDALRGKN